MTPDERAEARRLVDEANLWSDTSVEWADFASQAKRLVPQLLDALDAAERERDATILKRREGEPFPRDANGNPINTNTRAPFAPITDERLDYLDRWYRKVPSNSLMFCDGDFLEIRARLRNSETERDAARARLADVEWALNDIRAGAAVLAQDRDTARAQVATLVKALRWYEWASNGARYDCDFGGLARDTLAAAGLSCWPADMEDPPTEGWDKERTET